MPRPFVEAPPLCGSPAPVWKPVFSLRRSCELAGAFLPPVGEGAGTRTRLCQGTLSVSPPRPAAGARSSPLMWLRVV